MYCVKLQNILDETGNDYKLVKSFDTFLKNDCTTLERFKINPFKVSKYLNLNFDKTMEFLIICKKAGLLKPIAYFNCECGDTLIIKNKIDLADCENGCELIPSDFPERIYIYFELLEKLMDCKFVTQESYIGDYFNENFEVNEEPTLYAIEKKLSNQNIVESFRDNLFEEFLNDGE